MSHDNLLIERGQVWVSRARPDRRIKVEAYAAEHDDVIYHVIGKSVRRSIYGFNLRAKYRLDTMTEADEGHTFRISYESRMSSTVTGDEHHRDAPDFDGIVHTVEVRAWNLRDALKKAADLPFNVLMGEPSE